MRNVDLDVAALHADPAVDPNTLRGTWTAFPPGSIKPPARVVDSRQGRMYTPTELLIELGDGEKVLVCALAEQGYHAYRLAAYDVKWTDLCPHDLNYVAKPPHGTP